MDAPTCRLCDTKHWPREPHVFAASTRLDPPRGVTTAYGTTVAVTHSVTHAPTVTHSNAQTSNAQTPAEKQRKYRQAHAEQYRKANAERMAKKRAIGC